MTGKILAAFLLLFGGGITLYIIYKAALAMLQPVVQKKLVQQMRKEKTEQLQNSLKVHEQLDQVKVKEAQKNIKE